MTTLPPRSSQSPESESPLLRPCFIFTWLAWIKEGFGIKLIFHRRWYQKELALKPQADLMGPLIVGSDELQRDSISRSSPPAISSWFFEL